MRTILAALCSCAFVVALSAAPAQAGGYGYGGYGPSHVWYSSSCCYRRVVRHRRDVFYVRAGGPVAGGAVVVYPRPPRYALFAEPHQRVHFSAYDYYPSDGNYGLAGCYWREAPVQTVPGVWVWGRKVCCY
jgi:hypothetical protein